jgi:hypothetical protein
MRNDKRLLLFSCIAFIILFILLYPWYQYVLDPDATGYLKVAERIANADYARSVNSHWSPLNSWLLVPFLTAGCNGIITAKILNGVYALISLLAIGTLLKKFTLHRFTAVGIMIVAVIMLLHMAFYQLFGDLLNTMLLMIYLCIICSGNFIRNKKKIILGSIVLGLAYYAKYYSFYFGMFFSIVLFYVLLKKKEHPFPWKEWLKKTILACSVLFIIALPWGFALKAKYGSFTFTTSSQFNENVRLSTPSDHPKIVVMPLPYPDSYSSWDDPAYHFNGVYITPFTSWKFFLRELKVIASSFKAYVYVLNDFSFASIIILFIGILLWFLRDKDFIQNSNNITLLLFALLLPCGYLMLLIDYRYVWSIYFCLLILCGSLLTILYSKNWLNKNIFLFSCIIIFGGFCLYPVNQLQDQIYQGENLYELADSLAVHHVKGKFITNYTNGNEGGVSMILAYLGHDQFYGPSRIDITEEETLKLIKDNKIDFYLMFYSLPYQKQAILSSALAKQATVVSDSIYPGVIMLQYK